jgi:hypothetical protein
LVPLSLLTLLWFSLHPWNVVITYDGLAQVRSRVAGFEDCFVSTVQRSIKSLNGFGGTRGKEIADRLKAEHQSLEALQKKIMKLSSNTGPLGYASF